MFLEFIRVVACQYSFFKIAGDGSTVWIFELVYLFTNWWTFVSFPFSGSYE